MSIGTVEFDLSMVSPQTGEFLTARTYTVEGVTNADGSLRELSIGQLVMAICLARASKLETDIIALMEEMNTTSQNLADLTTVEQAVIDNFAAGGSGNAFDLSTVSVTDASGTVSFLRRMEVLNGTQFIVRNDYTESNVDIMYDDFITQIEAKMDEKNSFSQQKMIELQSLTNKRDQSYDMISNILKSLNTTIIGNVNNM